MMCTTENVLKIQYRQNSSGSVERITGNTDISQQINNKILGKYIVKLYVDDIPHTHTKKRCSLVQWALQSRQIQEKTKIRRCPLKPVRLKDTTVTLKCYKT